MKLLLDTHAFLWFIAGSPRLSTSARTAIEAPENQRFISAASIFEIPEHRRSVRRLRNPTALVSFREHP